jgi:hypothetical protein
LPSTSFPPSFLLTSASYTLFILHLP